MTVLSSELALYTPLTDAEELNYITALLLGFRNIHISPKYTRPVGWVDVLGKWVPIPRVDLESPLAQTLSRRLQATSLYCSLQP